METQSTPDFQPLTRDELDHIRHLAETANFATMKPENVQELVRDLSDSALWYLTQAEGYQKLRTQNRAAQATRRAKEREKAKELGITWQELRRRVKEKTVKL